MSRNGKRLFKNLSLGILGLGILGGAVALGTNYLKNDSVNIHPSYEIGGLTEYGKYVEDECKLYTKNKFACDGLKATLDFDNDISYKIFYYDILDNFIESTDSLMNGYSTQAPINGAYARIEITPLNDEDGKISFMEKLDYASQLNLSVSKKAKNVNDKYVSYKGIPFTIVNNIHDVIFVSNKNITDEFIIEDSSSLSAMTTTCLDVSDKKTLVVDSTITEELSGFGMGVFLFKDKLADGVPYDISDKPDIVDLTGYNYIVIKVHSLDAEKLLELTPTLNNYFSLQ